MKIVLDTFPLPDADDAMFVEVGVSSLARALVTGNLKHSPATMRWGLRVLRPREVADFWLRDRTR